MSAGKVSERMTGYLLAMLVLPLSGVLAWCAQGNLRRATCIAAIGNISACLFAMPSIYLVLYTAQIEPVIKLTHPFPLEQILVFQLGVLSAYFAIPVLLVSTLSSVFSIEGLERYRSRGPLGAWVGLANILTGLILLVLIARNGLLFVFAWEAMTLVALAWMRACGDPERKLRGDFTFNVIAHVCVVFLFVLFCFWKQQTGSFDFLKGISHWDTLFWNGSPIPIQAPTLILLLALLGFSGKAGIAPFQIWVPYTYPHLPGHVVAVLSGGMGLMGFYGLLRVLGLLGPQEALWNLQWGVVFIFLGLFTAIHGIYRAIFQHDLRQMLSYSSLQQTGIITLGIGVGLLGRSLPLTVDGESTGNVIALLGFGGALLHVLNHALFMSLLFLGTQAVLQATNTTDLNLLGGLSKRLNWTTPLFILGGVAICGLPPLNGFASLFLLYSGAVQEEVHATDLNAIPAMAIIGGLAFMGGLATVVYTKAIGIGFLGLPRSRQAAEAREVGWFMRGPMCCTAVGCVAIGLFAPRVVILLQPVLQLITIDTPRLHLAANLRESLLTLEALVLLGGVFTVLIIALYVLRWSLSQGREMDSSDTWNGGNMPTEGRSQMTATSFVEPVRRWFSLSLAEDKVEHLEIIASSHLPWQLTRNGYWIVIGLTFLVFMAARMIGWLR